MIQATKIETIRYVGYLLARASCRSALMNRTTQLWTFLLLFIPLHNEAQKLLFRGQPVDSVLIEGSEHHIESVIPVYMRAATYTIRFDTVSQRYIPGTMILSRATPLWQGPTDMKYDVLKCDSCVADPHELLALLLSELERKHSLSMQEMAAITPSQWRAETDPGYFTRQLQDSSYHCAPLDTWSADLAQSCSVAARDEDTLGIFLFDYASRSARSKTTLAPEHPPISIRIYGDSFFPFHFHTDPGERFCHQWYELNKQTPAPVELNRRMNARISQLLLQLLPDHPGFAEPQLDRQLIYHDYREWLLARRGFRRCGG